MNEQDQARWHFLKGVLPAEKPPVVVDVGANPLEDPAYKPLLDQGLCNVIGFEPQDAAYEELLKVKSENETYFPLALGDGSEATLNIYGGSGLSSIMTLSESTREYLGRSKQAARLLGTVDTKLTRLDDIADITHFDLLKIDVQGAEVSIFQNGQTKLSEAVLVISEVRFFELYEGEHLFDEQIRVLGDLGFRIHKFLALKSNAIASSSVGRLRKRRFGSQLLDGDFVFMKDLREIDGVMDAQLCSLALLADAVIGSYDVTLKCLDELQARCKLEEKTISEYFDMLPERIKK